VSRARVQKARELLADQERRLEKATDEAHRAMMRALSAIERHGVPLRRLVASARKAESAAGKLWSEAVWMVERRDDLARARAGKRKRRH
jgi:hypothetical protein